MATVYIQLEDELKKITSESGTGGVGIKKSEINASGELVITYTDGTTANLGKVVGEDGQDGTNGTNGSNGTNGKDGEDGRGIASATINSNGELVLTYTDNTTDNLGVVVGEDGQDATGGANGVTFTPSVDNDGNLSWTNDGGLTNPTTVNIKGPQGEQGIQGEKGEKGDTGTQGLLGWSIIPVYTHDELEFNEQDLTEMFNASKNSNEAHSFVLTNIEVLRVGDSIMFQYFNTDSYTYGYIIGKVTNFDPVDLVVDIQIYIFTT